VLINIKFLALADAALNMLISHHTINALLHYVVKYFWKIAMIINWVKQTAMQNSAARNSCQNTHPVMLLSLGSLTKT